MKARFFIDGQEIVEPNNYQELSLDLNFDKDNPKAQVTINQWELGVGSRTDALDGVKLATDHINGDFGVVEGQSFMIKVGSDVVFNGYFDLWGSIVSCDNITAEAFEQGGIDWLNENAEFTFEYLGEGLNNGDAGKILHTDFIPIPYIISEIPDLKDLMLTTLTITSTVIILIDQIQTLIEHIAGLINVFQILDLVKAVLRAAFIVGLVIQLIKLSKQAFNLIIQPFKYHYGMNVLLMCQKAAEYLGKNFTCPILETDFKHLVILPEKYQQIQNTTNDGVFGLLNANSVNEKGYYKGTFGDLLRQLKIMFKAKIFVTDTDIHLVREDQLPSEFTPAVSDYSIPDVEIDEYRFNRDDFYSNYLIDFAIDQNDKNTINEYEGTAIQIQTVPKTQRTQKTLTKGIIQNNIQFALGKRKTELTRPEKLFKRFFKIFDALLGSVIKIVNRARKVMNSILKTLNKIIKTIRAVGINWRPKIQLLKPIKLNQLEDLITDRINMLKMENDFITVPKMLLVEEKLSPSKNHLLPDNETKLSAEYLWNNYHNISSFDEVEYSETNQYLIYETPEIPFTCKDYLSVKNKNTITSPDGNKGRIDSLEWNPIKETAVIKYRINNIYLSNLKTEKLIPNGK